MSVDHRLKVIGHRIDVPRFDERLVRLKRSATLGDELAQMLGRLSEPAPVRASGARLRP